MTRTLRLRKDVLSELAPDEMRAVAAAAPPTYNCFASDGEARCLPTKNGCPWTGDPCIFTGPVTVTS